MALAGAQPLGICQAQVASRGPGDKDVWQRLSCTPQACTLPVPSGKHEAIRGPRSGRPHLSGSTGGRCSSRQDTPFVALAHDPYRRLRRGSRKYRQTFRALKSDGLALDDSQVIDEERMFNLAAIAFAGAIRTIQLVDQRRRPSSSQRRDRCILSFGPLIAGCCQAAILSLQWHADSDCSVELVRLRRRSDRGWRDDRLVTLHIRCRWRLCVVGLMS